MPYYAGDPGVLSDIFSRAKSALAPVGKELLAGVLGGGPPKMPGLPSGLAGLTSTAPKLPPGALGGLGKAIEHARAGGAAEEQEARHYRRTNVLNPRALRRAMRRVQGFAKFATKTMSFTKRHKLKKHRRR